MKIRALLKPAAVIAAAALLLAGLGLCLAAEVPKGR